MKLHKAAKTPSDALYAVASNTFHRIDLVLTNALSIAGMEQRLMLYGEQGAFRIFTDTNQLPVAVSSLRGTAYTLPPQTPPLATRTFWLECLKPATGGITNVYWNAQAQVPVGAHGVSIAAVDIRLLADTDNNGTIDPPEGEEHDFAPYAPGQFFVLKGNPDGVITNSPRIETKFQLKPDILKQSGVVKLAATNDNACVEFWSAQAGGTQYYAPVMSSGTFNDPKTIPPTFWGTGVSTGTTYMAVSYAMVDGGQAITNLTAYTAIPPISFAPAVSNAYVWCSLPIELGRGDGLRFHEELEKQGFSVEWFEDADDYDIANTFGDCTLANYKKMANSGALTVISHGSEGEHLAVYAPLTPDGYTACTNWCAGELGMTVKTNRFVDNLGVFRFDKSYYYVSVDTSWLAANWKPTLDANRAITMWSICYSADTSTGTSVKEAAGGRWRSGYELPVCMEEAMDVNNEFLKRMNGTIARGNLRTSGSACNDPAVDYKQIYQEILIYSPTYEYDDDFDNIIDRWIGSVKMEGDWWTTLCPAPLALAPVYPDSTVNEKRKGFGCILLDTALDNTRPATDAVVKNSGGAVIFNTHWLEDTKGSFYGVGFTFDKTTDNARTTMKAISTQIRNEGAEGRQMDGNRIHPNNDDREWSY